MVHIYFQGCINGEHSEPFKHKRGLRQGDPLSPMLFIIATDVFQMIVQALNQILNSSLSGKLDESIIALQYADDTAMVTRADVDILVSFKLVLRLFSKSCYIPLNVAHDDSNWVRAILCCTQTSFLIDYLGLPLTIKKPTKQLYIPLIEKIEKRVQGWQSRFLSRWGKTTACQNSAYVNPNLLHDLLQIA